MASSSNPSHSGDPASIFISQLPTNKLLAELKALIAGHFANFGKILRISCATNKKERERIGHVQFSSSREAHEAWKHGKIMDGHEVIITITEKIPNTKMLAVTPQPRRSTLMPMSGSNTDSTKESKPRSVELQTTLESYFVKQGSSTSVKDEKKGPNISKASLSPNVALNEKVGSTSSVSVSANISAAASTEQADSDVKKKEPKPSSCQEVVMYKGGQGSSSSIPSTSVPVAPASPTLANQSVTRPPQKRRLTLKEILNLDTSGMKIVKTTSASDVLALQYFQGGPMPFSLSLLFNNKIPGNLVMPLKSLMDSVKPGMKLDDSTIEMVWNTISKGSLKIAIRKATHAFLRDSLIEHFASETVLQLINGVVDEQLNDSFENETEREVDVLVCCEDVVDTLLHFACIDYIKDTFSDELRTGRIMSKALNCCFRKLMDTVVAEVVTEAVPGIAVDILCKEVVDDILESPIFERHVKVVAGGAMRNSLQARNEVEEEEEEESSDSECDSAVRSRKAVSDLMPSISSVERTENWLLANVFNVNEDLDSLESYSSVGTNTSCSVQSSSSSPTTAKPSRRLEPSSSTGPRIVERRQGLFGSLKRKAVSLYEYFDSKRPKFMRKSGGQ